MGFYTLGLDIGSNSVGWALLDKSEKPSITAIGVRVFPEGVDRDTKGFEKSKNATRREARGARRTHQRRNLRKEQLLKTLQTAGLLPENDSGLMTLFQKNAYELRKKGLDEKLEPYEFGRILYHISQRRGLKSNRKSGKAREDGVIIKGANTLQTEMDNNGCRTIGEYFAGVNPEEQRIRGRYTFRSMYEKEFDLLWQKQSEYYSQVLTEDLRKRIRDEIIFFQRPMRWDPATIGDCELETGEKRCPRGDWYARRFKILQDVNNLKIRNPDGTENKLTTEQRNLILDELSKKKELKYDDIRKKLGLMETQVFNLEQDGKVKALKGDGFAAAMRSKNLLGSDKWDEMLEAEKIELNNALVELEDDELKEKITSEYGFKEEQAEKVLAISLPQGYMSFSRKAIIKLLEFMEQGALTSEATEVVYRDRKKGEAVDTSDKLPLPEDLRNPIVNKALVEVRKVVNAILREYGKPTKIVIEMARDVKGSRREREELHFKMLENEKRNEEVRQRLMQDMNITNPKREDGIKYKLWEECGRRCPYTGKPISQAALFGLHPEFQVEHILPYDRSLDDSFMNKTLCEVHENIHVKKNQTPYEAYSHNPEKYEQIKQNIKVLPWQKRQKFLQKEIELDAHISRELNDTRYICREVVKYLKQLGIHVRGTRGKITAELRHQWGLDGIFKELSAERDTDHRRHAVDAAVVAVTENEHLRKLAQTKYASTGHNFDEPWEGFRNELREKISKVCVSHRVQRKVSGALHEETSYGPTCKKDEKGQDVFVYRKRLEDLTIPKVEKIVDHIVREIVKGRLKEKGIDLESSNRKIPKEVWTDEPLYMKTTKSNKKVQIKKVRIKEPFNNMIPIKDETGKPYRYVSPGSNHHIEIFEYTDKKGNVQRDGRIVTMFDAVQRSRRGEAVVKKEYGDGGKFICSLAINDMFMMELDGNSKVPHRVQKITQSGKTTSIILRPHIYAGQLKDTDKPPLIQRKSPNTLKGYKVAVDPIGRIWQAKD